MQVGPSSIPSADRTQVVRREVADAIRTIETSADSFEVGGTSRLSKPVGNYIEGEVTRQAWSTDPTKVHVISKDGDTTVVLRSEILPKDTAGVQVAGALVGGIIGHLLFGRGEKSSLIGEVAGAAIGAWGAKQASEGPGERLIERIQTDREGVTTERIKVDEKGNESYTSEFRRTGPAPVLTPEQIRDNISKLEI